MKKLLLTTIALLQAVPVQATYDPESESPVNIIRQQNDAYAKTLYIEMVEKNDQYSRIKSALERCQKGFEQTHARLKKFPENPNIQNQLQEEQRNLSQIQEDHDFCYFRLFETYRSECARTNVQPVPSLFPPLLTMDHLSEAGKAFRGVGDKLNSESSLLQAVKLNHASAPRILYGLYGEKNPTYRELLLQCVRKKLKAGFDHGLYEDLGALGHTILQRSNFSLKEALAEVDNQPVVDKKARSYYYLVSSAWKELADQITDGDASDEVSRQAKIRLEQLFAEGDQNAKTYLGKIALDEGNFKQAAVYLFDKDLVNFIITNGQRARTLDPDWLHAVQGYLNRIADEALIEKLEAYQTLGIVYRETRNFEQAFESFFEAYQLAFQLNWSSEQRYPLFMACNKCIDVQNTDFSGKEKLGKYHYFGYRLHTFLADQEQEEAKKQEEIAIAQQFLKTAILEGEMDVLNTVLTESKNIFESSLQCAKFLEELVTNEHAKEGSPFDAYKTECVDAINKIKAKLLELFRDASEEEISLKTSTVKSLVKFYSSKISDLAKDNQISSSHLALYVMQDTLNFLNEHKKDMLDLMRKMDVMQDDPDSKWLLKMKTDLNKIYAQGVFQMQELRGSPGFMKKIYLIVAENPR